MACRAGLLCGLLPSASMINKPQKVLTSQDSEISRPVTALYKSTEEIIDTVNYYLPPVTTYQMGTTSIMMLGANSWTPFLNNNLTAFYSDSVDTSLVEIHVVYVMGVTDFIIRIKENVGTNPKVLWQGSALGGPPVVTSRNLVMAKFAVGQCVAKANMPYMAEVSSPSGAANLYYALNLKVVRGVRP